MYNFNLEQFVIYDITSNAIDENYVFSLDESMNIDWNKVIEIALQQRCFSYIYTGLHVLSSQSEISGF